MTPEGDNDERFRVVVVGGGVTALEAVLALARLAGDRVATTVLAPNDEFSYRPMTVREPFTHRPAARYPLRSIVADAGAELVPGKLGWVEPERRLVHSDEGVPLSFDALLLAPGAILYPRYRHAVTIDDRDLHSALSGLVRDVQEGAVRSVAFVAPGRMAWPLPLYELALMTAGRAHDANVDLEATIVTSEERPLAVFGRAVSDGVADLLAEKRIRVITSAEAEVPHEGEVEIHPGGKRLHPMRVVALPELYGPSVRGLPVSEHGFVRVNRYCRVPDAGPVFAAGDAVDFPVKQGGIGCQQADAAAESIAKLAGVDIEPHPFDPVLRGLLLTDTGPRYLAADIAGGRGSASVFSDSPIDGVTDKIAARYLAAYLASREVGITA